MPQGILTENGSSNWFKILKGDVHIGVHNIFGGGTIRIEQEIKNNVFDVLEEGLAITFTVADDSVYNLQRGDKVRITLTGAVSPELFYSIQGA